MSISRAGAVWTASSHRFSVGFPHFSEQLRGELVRLKDKVAIVTGGGRGIGRDIVLAYARECAHGVVNDVDPATADATAKEAAALGSNSLAVAADIAKSTDIARLVETTVKERGRVDILVKNAL